MSTNANESKKATSEIGFLQSISIDGGRWEVNVDTFYDRSQFPASYHGDCCDISIRTNTASVDFMMAIGNVIRLHEAIENEITNPGHGIDDRLSITNLVINGRWYSAVDMTVVLRTPLKCYITFCEKDFHGDTDENYEEDWLEDYDIVIRLHDLADIVRRIIENYKRLKK